MAKLLADCLARQYWLAVLSSNIALREGETLVAEVAVCRATQQPQQRQATIIVDFLARCNSAEPHGVKKYKSLRLLQKINKSVNHFQNQTQ